MYHYVREFNPKLPFFKYLDAENFGKQLDFFGADKRCPGTKNGHFADCLIFERFWCRFGYRKRAKIHQQSLSEKRVFGGVCLHFRRLCRGKRHLTDTPQ